MSIGFGDDKICSSAGRNSGRVSRLTILMYFYFIYELHSLLKISLLLYVTIRVCDLKMGIIISVDRNSFE